MAESPEIPRNSDSSSSQLINKAPNFSRPRPQSAHRQPLLKHDDTSQVRIISAFHEPNREMPSEPRFSLDSEQTDSSHSQHSAASEFAWDGQAGELRSRRRPQKYDEQRFERNGRSATGVSGSTAASSEPPNTIGIPRSEASSTSSKKPKIVKRVSFDQQSERMSVSTSGQWEDTASHHTVSESGDSGSIDEEGRWQSSDYDISGLSEAEIRKLRKKGINPALYAEMKAARKGKNKFGPLLGNGFIS